MSRLIFLVLSFSTLSQIFSLEGTWDDGHGCIGWKIEFKSEQDFQIYVSCMGPQASISGKYEVKGDRIQFKKYETDFASYVDGKNSAASLSIEQVENRILKGACRIISIKDDARYSEGIKCNGIKSIFLNHNSAPKSDTQLNFKGIPVVTLGLKYGKTTDCVRMREKPSPTAKIERYIIELDENKTSECIRKGERIRVHARTLRKDKVKSMENYWYLIHIGWHEDVWVFAEFVSLEQ